MALLISQQFWKRRQVYIDYESITLKYSTLCIPRSRRMCTAPRASYTPWRAWRQNGEKHCIRAQPVIWGMRLKGGKLHGSLKVAAAQSNASHYFPLLSFFFSLFSSSHEREWHPPTPRRRKSSLGVVIGVVIVIPIMSKRREDKTVRIKRKPDDAVLYAGGERRAVAVWSILPWGGMGVSLMTMMMMLSKKMRLRARSIARNIFLMIKKYTFYVYQYRELLVKRGKRYIFNFFEHLQ